MIWMIIVNIEQMSLNGVDWYEIRDSLSIIWFIERFKSNYWIFYSQRLLVENVIH